MSRRLPRPLDAVEIRVLGSLLEKEQTTPEAYPLSLNALLLACNQKTNREPVTQLDEAEVCAALERLRQDVLVWRTEGARVERWKQSVERRWDLDPAAKAVLTLLLLRGPQTTGQLRERSARMWALGSLDDTEQLLARLAAQEEPLVGELPRQPGQKEGRWTHRAGLPAAAEPEAAVRQRPEADHEAGAPPSAPRTGRPAAAAPESGSDGPLAALAARLERLEARVAELEERASSTAGKPD
jgi:uncharacterized protein